jgi:hypothetical protein
MQHDICVEPGRSLRFWPDWLLTLIETTARLLIALLLLTYC